MKLRYQMRGLGIGIIITALLMGVATGKGIPLSDAEIKAKALELGMVESNSVRLTDIANLSSEEETGGTDPGQTGAGEAGGVGEPAETGEPDSSDGWAEGGETGSSEGLEESGEAGGSDESAENGDSKPGAGESSEGGNEETKGLDSGEAVTVVIEFGVTSYHVSEILAEAGLVEDAAGFDAYLCSSGLSRKITAGTYEILPGTTEEEIIDIITKNR